MGSPKVDSAFGELGLHVVIGTGPAGCATARALLAQGLSVRMISRSGKRHARVPPSTSVAAVDAADPAALRQAAHGAAVLYQCVNVPYQDWAARLPSIQQGIIRVAQDLGARLVVLDNLYMYGPVQGPITEDLPPQAQTKKGRIRARLADMVMEAHGSGRIRAAIGRASDFYGPGVTDAALGPMVWDALLAGKPAAVLGNPNLPHTYSYIEDVGLGLAILGTHPEALGEIWHLPAAPAITTRQLLELACRQEGLTLRLRPMGRWMLRTGGLFMPVARETLELLYQWEAPFIMDDAKFRQTFGAEATPLEKGIAETVAWYRSRRAQHR